MHVTKNAANFQTFWILKQRFKIRFNYCIDIPFYCIDKCNYVVKESVYPLAHVNVNFFKENTSENDCTK